MITRTKTVSGFYGSGRTACDVICAEDSRGCTWYAVEGSVNVNCTCEPVEDGVNVETLSDIDTFTWPEGIDSEETLVLAIES